MELDCRIGRGVGGSFSRAVKQAGLAACMVLGAMAMAPSAAWAQCGGGCASGNCAVVNGDFETGDFTGWMQFGDTGYTAVNSGSFVNLTPHGGVYGAHFGPLGTGGILQTIAANAGDQVVIDFWYSAGPFAEADPTEQFSATFDGNVLVSLTSDTTNTGWVEFTFPVTVSAANPVLQFSFTNIQEYDYLDDISVCVTPGGTGACCAPDGSCAISTPANPCVSGVFGGVDSACAPSGQCPIAVGACCNALTGACAYVAGSGACGGNSVYSGDGSACSPNACPSGACCNDTTSACTMSGSACPAGSTYQGAGSVCTIQLCPNNSCGSACGAGTLCASINGGFETGDFSGWTQFGDIEYNSVFTGVSDDEVTSPHGGTYAAEFGPTDAAGGGIEQTVPAHAGDQVTIGFWYNASGGGPNSFSAVFDGQTLVSFTDDVVNTSWTQFSYTVTVGADNPVLQFTFYNSPSWSNLDDVTVCVGSAAQAGVCCRGSTCNTTVAQAGCTGSGTAGAAFVAASSTCNSGAISNSPCCYADYNKANGVTVQDIFDFLSDWFAGNPFAKVGGDGTPGTLAVQNIFDFLTNWFAGGCN